MLYSCYLLQNVTCCYDFDTHLLIYVYTNYCNPMRKMADSRWRDINVNKIWNTVYNNILCSR